MGETTKAETSWGRNGLGAKYPGFDQNRWAPRGFGIWGEWHLFSGSWGALVIILGELGSKLIILGI